MPLAMLPNKSLQHCQEQMIRAIVYKIDGMSITIFEAVSISCNQNKIGKWPIIYMLNII